VPPSVNHRVAHTAGRHPEECGTLAAEDTSVPNPASNFRAMRKTAWVWFVGCAVWFADGVVHLRLRAVPHAQLAFMLAMLFFVAGLFYRQQQR